MRRGKKYTQELIFVICVNQSRSILLLDWPINTSYFALEEK